MLKFLSFSNKHTLVPKLHTSLLVDIFPLDVAVDIPFKNKPLFLNKDFNL